MSSSVVVDFQLPVQEIVDAQLHVPAAVAPSSRDHVGVPCFCLGEGHVVEGSPFRLEIGGDGESTDIVCRFLS